MPPTLATDMYAYAADIVKADKQTDGTLMVYGKAAGPDLDLDEQRCNPDWLKGAMPEWFEWGNVREQHGNVVAGVGVEMEDKGNGNWFVKAHVVDPTTVKKVEAGALKGFSIGVKHGKLLKTAAMPKGWIVAGNIVELSLVDRPCNPTAKINIVKSAGGIGDPLEPVEVVDEDGDTFSAQPGLSEPSLFDDEDEPDYPVRPQAVDDAVDDVAKGVGIDEDGEIETVEDLRKGFIMDLLKGKNLPKNPKGHGKRDGDGDGKIGEAAAELKIKRMVERANQAKADKTSDMAHAENLRDAEHARLAGRSGEAAHHLTAAAGHARNNNQRRTVRRERGQIAAAAIREKSAAPDEILEWVTDVEDILGPDEGVMSAAEYRGALALVRKSVSGDITKAARDESGDIAGAEAAVAQIADLIISEAQQLKDGRPEEIDDIAILIEACRALWRFCHNEKRQETAGGTSAFTSAEYAVEADLFKELDIDTPEEITSIDSGDGATLVDAGAISKAVTEATVSLQAEIDTLRETLAKVEKTAKPGGPFIMSTVSPVTKAASPQETEAARLRREALKVTDPGIRDAYLQAAAAKESASA